MYAYMYTQLSKLVYRLNETFRPVGILEGWFLSECFLFVCLIFYLFIYFCQNVPQRKHRCWRDTQWLRAVAVLAEALGSVCSTHMVDNNHLKLQFQGAPIPSSGLGGHQACTWYTDVPAAKTYT